MNPKKSKKSDLNQKNPIFLI